MWATLLCVAMVSAPRATVETIDGRSLTGELVGLSSDAIKLSDDVSLPAREALSITLERDAPPANSKPSAEARLTDGSSIRFDKIRIEGDTATVEVAGGGEFRAPARSLLSVRLTNAGPDDAWNRIIDGDHAADILVVRGADQLDYLEGALGDATEESLQFTTDGETLSVKWAKIAGWKYFRPQSKTPAAACLVTDVHGSQLAAQSVELKADTLTVRGEGWSRELPLASVSELDYSRGKTVRLGSITPESVKWTPYFSTGESLPFVRKYFEPRIDRGVNGPLLLDGVAYSQGLCIHSRTELVYRLPDGATSFQALTGIDDSARGLGAVRLSIFADESRLFEEIVRGDSPPQKLSLSIVGARRLKILVDFGPGRDESDFLNLCNARIVK